MTDAEFASTIKRLRDQYLLPALKEAAAEDQMPFKAPVVALCETAVTSCGILSENDPPSTIQLYRTYRDEAFKLFFSLEGSDCDG